MNRRRFIRNTSLALPGWLLLPPFMESCKKKEWLPESDFKGSVAIIGAGAAGLYAAHLLHQRGISVRLFEASDRWGGRIRPLTGFSDFPVELGAEEIHGSNSVFYSLVAASGAAFASDDLTDFAELDGVLQSSSEIESDPDVIQMQELIDSLDEYSGADISALAYANVNGLPARVQHFFNAELANERGTSLDRIGMAGLQEEAALWASGEDNYMLRAQSILSIFETAFADILPKITLNTPITQINWGGSNVVLTAQNGDTFQADRVIITSSIKVLQDDLIEFAPSLPATTIQGINRIGMDRGMKVILKFSSRFWPEDTGSIFTSGYVPEYWATGAGGRSAENNLLTGLICGSKAEELHLLDLDLVPALLQELDALYDGQATALYADSYVMDWGNENWVRGAYSYPRQGTGNARTLLAEPVGNRLFFAGEATHQGGHHASVHGAMETGLRAVMEVLQS
jgi:monoamine oxidase